MKCEHLFRIFKTGNGGLLQNTNRNSDMLFRKECKPGGFEKRPHFCGLKHMLVGITEIFTRQ
jgi:hypothetical protein